MTQRYVDSSDGVRIAVYEQGNPDGPTLVLAHGYPDTHRLWDPIVPLLADRFRIIRYDNRGAGESSEPKRTSAYRMERFADDFAAVIDAVSADRAVHVLAHDWGSSGVWEFLARPAAAGRVASFTSVSGPSPRHVRRYLLDTLSRPLRAARFVQGVRQLGRLAAMGAPLDPGEDVSRQRRPAPGPTASRSPRRRAGTAHRQHPGPVSCGPTSTTTPTRGPHACGGATSGPDTRRPPRTRRCWRARCTSSSTTSTAPPRPGNCCGPRSAARADRSATLSCR